MARVTYVKRAQQRYETKPVLDEQGRPIKIGLTKKDGSPKVDKRGNQVFITKTVDDRDKPKPNHVCEVCRTEIKPGDPYKHITPRSGPYGGRMRVRCGTCPTWQYWDYSDSLSAQTAQIAYEFETTIGSVESPEDATDALTTAADAVREIAEAKRESASNIEEGFGHSTYVSDELNDVADQLDSWADEIESVDVPELPEPEETDCETCEGDGADPDDPSLECTECSGTGQVTPDEPTEEQMEEWRSEVADACSIVNEPPV